MTDNEGHGFRCSLARRHDQIAFIFTVVVIDHHDHFTVPNRRKRFFDGIENSWVSVVVAHGLVALSETVREPSTGIYVQTVKVSWVLDSLLIMQTSHLIGVHAQKLQKHRLAMRTKAGHIRHLGCL